MAWETRGNGRRYYYRARRVNGRVVKTYVGAGEIGAAAAAADAAEREVRLQQRGEQKRRRAQWLGMLETFDALADAVEAYAAAALLTHGWYCHSGEWRPASHARHRETRADEP